MEITNHFPLLKDLTLNHLSLLFYIIHFSLLWIIPIQTAKLLFSHLKDIFLVIFSLLPSGAKFEILSKFIVSNSSSPIFS